MTERDRLYKLTIALSSAFSAASSEMQLTDTLEQAVKGAEDRLMDRYNSARYDFLRRQDKDDADGMEHAKIEAGAVRLVLEWLKGNWTTL